MDKTRSEELAIALDPNVIEGLKAIYAVSQIAPNGIPWRKWRQFGTRKGEVIEDQRKTNDRFQQENKP